MPTLVPIILLGFFLGMRHATDPDHIIAVTTIVNREPSLTRALAIGALWGLGHTVTVGLVGGAVIVFGLVIPPRLGLTMELSVALMLIVLGILGLRRFDARIGDDGGAHHGRGAAPPHAHAHAHGDYVHSHAHAHGPERHGHREDQTPQAWLDRTFGRVGLYQVLRPVVVGVVHGLAGSAAVALLVLASIREVGWAVAYLLVFGAGTIAGMMVVTVAVAAPFLYLARRVGRLNRCLVTVSGLLSLGFGLFLVYQIGWVDGLFTGRPTWTPR
jgi:ABC-type nickel/cobalt efflux system permease component RcnA